MYASGNPPTKKALKERVARYMESLTDPRTEQTIAHAGNPVRVFQPGLGEVPRNGDVDVEGPHYPAAHTWYAICTLRDGIIVKVR